MKKSFKKKCIVSMYKDRKKVENDNVHLWQAYYLNHEARENFLSDQLTKFTTSKKSSMLNYKKFKLFLTDKMGKLGVLLCLETFQFRNTRLMFSDV